MKNNEKLQKLIRQILKFGVVGVLSCVIDFAIYYGMYNFLGIHYLVAGFFGFVISLVFNYYCSMAFVFASKDGVDKRAEFMTFMILSLIGLGLTELIMWIVVDGIYIHVPMIQCAFLDEYIKLLAKVIATGIVMIYNFVTRKIFIEKKD